MPVDLVFGNSQTGPNVAGHRLARAKGLVEGDVHGLIFRGESYQPYVKFTGRPHGQFCPEVHLSFLRHKRPRRWRDARWDSGRDSNGASVLECPASGWFTILSS